MITIRTAPKSLVADLWPFVGPLLAEALDRHPFMLVDELRDIVRERDDVDLLVAYQDARILGAAVIELQQFPTTSTGHVLALGGRYGFYRNGLEQLTHALEGWCAAHGCDNISALGVPGWTKFMSRRGWQLMPAVAAWKKITPEVRAASGGAR